MKVNIKATNLELNEAIGNYVQEKVNMLDKYLGGIKVINCDFEVEQTTNRQTKGKIFRAEINLEIPGKLLRVDKTEKNLYKAIDKVKDHLAQMIVKHKEKRRER